MNKIVLFAFNGESMCFAHVLLNAFDMKEKDYEVAIVIEGTATKLVKILYEDSSLPFAGLYKKAKEQGLIAGVCEACASKMGSKQSAIEQGLPLLKDIQGHPSVAEYIQRGYQVLTF